MAEVIISYRQTNRAFVEKLAHGLAARGVEAWFDRREDAGENFGADIREQIRNARAVIVCWSPAAFQSPSVLAEAQFALIKGKLLPVVAEPCGLKDPFNREPTEDLTRWSGEASHPGWQRLLSALERKLGRTGLAEPGAVVAPVAIEPSIQSPPDAVRARSPRRWRWVAGGLTLVVASLAAVGWFLVSNQAAVDRVERVGSEQSDTVSPLSPGKVEVETNGSLETASAESNAPALDTRAAAVSAQQDTEPAALEATRKSAPERLEAKTQTEALTPVSAEPARLQQDAYDAIEASPTKAQWDAFILQFGAGPLVERAKANRDTLVREAERSEKETADRCMRTCDGSCEQYQRSAVSGAFSGEYLFSVNRRQRECATGAPPQP